MKRLRKLNKKPDPVEKLSDESDTDEEHTQPTRKKREKNTFKVLKPHDESDSEGKSQPKRRARNKKAPVTTKPMEGELSDNSDSEEKPTIKKKGKNKKVSDTKELKAESSDHSDFGEKSQNNKKKKNKKVPDIREPKGKPSDQILIDSSEKFQIKKKGKKKKASNTIEPKEESSDHSDNLQQIVKPEDAESSDNEVEVDSEAHLRSLQNLQATDPGFYNFLAKHDAELLKFDHENLLDPEENDDDFEENDDKVHVPGELLENSDESDFEAEDGQIKGRVTLKMVQDLTVQLTSTGKKKASTIIHAAKLFHAAVQRVTSEDGTSEGEFTVAGSSVFNSILSTCVLNLAPTIREYLGMESSATDPRTCKHYVKIKGTMIQYVDDCIKLLSVVTSDSILSTMLKHLHQLSSFAACYPRLAKKAIKKILPLWVSGDETIRVLAFVCILRITTSNQEQLLDKVLKTMHLTYLRNCKFVSPTTWPGINFMRRSLCEMYGLDLDVAYKHAFLFIRQLGIHLRNAFMVPKLEHRLAVYNWQYLNSLHLWAELIRQSVDHEGMKSLIFPLSMIISNTIKVVPTPQYYPVRFYLIQVLMDMEKESGIFIPTLGFMMDVLIDFKFNKKQKKASMKPIDMSCILRLSKSQMLENGFVDAVVERIYALVLEYCVSISWDMAFPEMVMFLEVQLKYLVNNTTDPNNAKKFKQLLDKILENTEFMVKERVVCTKMLRTYVAPCPWEAQMRAKSTPLMKFYEDWKKVHQKHKRKVSLRDDVLLGHEMPKRIPSVEAEKTYYKDPLVPINILPSDSEDEKDYFNIEVSPKEKREKKKKRNIKPLKDEVQIPDTADAGDIVQEFSAKDW